MQTRQISKTVQRRQLKRLRPQHYEILVRYLNGQSRKDIAAEMNIGEQRLSVIINSPVFQEELRMRWEVKEQAIIQRLKEREERRIEAATAMMRDGVGDPSILDQPSVFDGVGKRRRKRHEDQDGLGEFIIKELSRMSEDEKKTATAKPSEIEPTPSKPEPKEPETTFTAHRRPGDSEKITCGRARRQWGRDDKKWRTKPKQETVTT